MNKNTIFVVCFAVGMYEDTVVCAFSKRNEAEIFSQKKNNAIRDVVALEKTRSLLVKQWEKDHASSADLEYNRLTEVLGINVAWKELGINEFEGSTVQYYIVETELSHNYHQGLDTQ